VHYGVHPRERRAHGRGVADVAAVDVKSAHLVSRLFQPGAGGLSEPPAIAGEEEFHFTYFTALPSTRSRRSSPPRTRRRPRMPRPAVVSITLPAIARPSVREAASTNAPV